MAGLALLALSVLVEGRLARYPLVPLGVFRHRAISAANGIAATIGAGLFGMYFFVSLFLQQVEGLSPLQTGVQIVPAGLATLGAALLAPRMVAVLGNRRQLVLGPAVAALGLLWMAQVSPGDSYWSALFGPLVHFGVGIGITFVPMTLAATTGLPPHQAGLASGLVNTTRQMGGALGLAILATVAEHTTAHATGSASAALATGYDRAFLCAGLILLIGAAVAFLIPAATPAPVPVPAQSTAPAPSPLPAQAPAAVAEPGPAAVEPGAAEI
jgi:predicted MFS family arabinose efflux permease